MVSAILAEHGPKAAKLFDNYKKKRTFPDNQELSQLFPADAQAMTRQTLDGAVTEFTNAIANNSQRAWHQALLKRGIEQDWDKMGVFIGGGGAAIRRVYDTLQQGMQNQLLRRVEVRHLPAPDAEQMERVPGLPLLEFHRIAVAYGLTLAHNFEDNLIWPRDIAPREIKSGSSLIPPQSKYEDRYISKDMV